MIKSFANIDGDIWLNGTYVSATDAKIHILSYSLHYGAGVFEGMRAYGGKIFKLREHLSRLVTGCNALGIQLPVSETHLQVACHELLQRNKLSDAYLRPVVWLGPEAMSLTPHKARVNIAVAAWTWPSYFDSEGLSGIKVAVSKWRKPSTECMPSNLKAAGNYMIPGLARKEAAELGYDDAIMLDAEGNIAELTAANFFAVRDSVLYTPRTHSILNGITRQEVISIAKHNRIQVIEKDLKVSDFKYFSECFATGTAVEVLPITKVGMYNYRVGEVTQLLSACYLDAVHQREPSNLAA